MSQRANLLSCGAPQRTTACSWVKGLAGLFAAQGLDAARVLCDAGIDPARLDRPDARFGVDELSALWEQAVTHSGRGDLGLDRQLAARFGNFDLVGASMLASDSLRAALEGMARYMPVVSNAAPVLLQPASGGAAWVLLGSAGNTRPIPRQRLAFGMLSLLLQCEWLVRRPLVPLAMEWRFAEPPEAARYRDVFACPARFGQPENRMLLAAADLDAPLPLRNGAMVSLHEPLLRERLAQVGGASVSAQVLQQIMRCLPEGEPRREQAAGALGMADRTLQRRLQAEHTSFAALLDGARREMACRLLADDLPLDEVGRQLGFSEPANFFRACRRWFGEAPAQYRRRVVDGEAPLAPLHDGAR